MQLVTDAASPHVRQAFVPTVVNEVIDRAMQLHGAEGICRASARPLERETPPARISLADMTCALSLSIANRGHPSGTDVGRRPHPPLRRRASLIPPVLPSRASLTLVAAHQGPDEVHLDQLGRTELTKVPAIRAKHERFRRREEEVTKGQKTASKL